MVPAADQLFTLTHLTYAWPPTCSQHNERICLSSSAPVHTAAAAAAAASECLTLATGLRCRPIPYQLTYSTSCGEPGSERESRTRGGNGISRWPPPGSQRPDGAKMAGLSPLGALTGMGTRVKGRARRDGQGGREAQGCREITRRPV